MAIPFLRIITDFRDNEDSPYIYQADTYLMEIQDSVPDVKLFVNVNKYKDKINNPLLTESQVNKFRKLKIIQPTL